VTIPSSFPSTEECVELSEPYRLRREERDIHVDGYESEDLWHVYTSSKPIISQLDKWTASKQIH
jgi:hypothetical protein